MSVYENDRFMTAIDKFIEINSKDEFDIDVLASVKQLINIYNIVKESYNQDSDSVLVVLNKCRWSLPTYFIIDSKTNFTKIDNIKELALNRSLDSFGSEKELLDFIVNYARNMLMVEHKQHIKLSKREGFDALDLVDLCRDASFFVEIICCILKVPYKIVKIDPGFDESLNLFNGSGYHYVVIVTLNGKDYLVDCTYKQFFEVRGSLLEAMGIIGFNALDAGYYMMIDDSRRKTASELINNGWIALTEINMKNYFDGFTLAARNASFYDNLGYVDFTTSYTANDYENFIFGDDNQANHEAIETLGYQRRLVKNDLTFETEKSILANLYY